MTTQLAVKKVNFTSSLLSSVVPPSRTVIAKGDSAASQNYWRQQDAHCLSDLKPY